VDGRIHIFNSDVSVHWTSCLVLMAPYLVHKGAASSVDEVRGVLHAGECGRVDEVPSCVVEWAVQGHKV